MDPEPTKTILREVQLNRWIDFPCSVANFIGHSSQTSFAVEGKHLYSALNPRKQDLYRTIIAYRLP